MTTLRRKPATIEFFCLNLDADGFTFSPLDIVLEVFLGHPAYDAGRQQDENCEHYQQNYQPSFHVSTFSGPIDQRMLACRDDDGGHPDR